jgi:hypothetical protein
MPFNSDNSEFSNLPHQQFDALMNQLRNTSSGTTEGLRELAQFHPQGAQDNAEASAEPCLMSYVFPHHSALSPHAGFQAHEPNMNLSLMQTPDMAVARPHLFGVALPHVASSAPFGREPFSVSPLGAPFLQRAGAGAQSESNNDNKQFMRPDTKPDTKIFGLFESAFKDEGFSDEVLRNDSLAFRMTLLYACTHAHI